MHKSRDRDSVAITTSGSAPSLASRPDLASPRAVLRLTMESQHAAADSPQLRPPILNPERAASQEVEEIIVRGISSVAHRPLPPIQGIGVRKSAGAAGSARARADWRLVPQCNLKGSARN